METQTKSRYPRAITFVAVSILIVLVSASIAGASKKKMPRKWESFKLGDNINDLKKDLVLFKCSAPNPDTQECRLTGYPQRDDFVVLKFFRNRLVSMAEFRYKADWEKTLENLKDQLGDPSAPNYQSDRAVAYIWQDSKTHITLTHLMKSDYVVYEISDRATAPLYRRSIANPK